MKKFFTKMFSKDEVNCGRQIEIDIAKAITIIGMLFCHALECFNYAEGSGGFFEFFIMRIQNTLLGATLFMFCMGIGICYTRKNDPNSIIIRGLKIFLVGFILNICRYGINEVILHFTMGDDVVSLEDIITCLIENDILYFAGLAMTLFGLLKKIKMPNWGILLLSVAMSIIGTIFNGYDLNNIFANGFIGWFIGTRNNSSFGTTSYFPLFNWFIMVCAGYYFGLILKRVSNKKQFYMFFSTICAVGVGIYLGLCIPFKVGFFKEDFICTFHIATYDALISVVAAIALFGLLYALSFILPKFLINGSKLLSKCINSIYCISWVIYGNLELLLSDYTFEFWHLVLMAIGCLIISIVLAWLYKVVWPRYKKQKASQQQPC